MVNSGATCNFMKDEVVKELGLKLEISLNSFKAINSKVEKVVGMANGVTLKLGVWESLCNLVYGMELQT